MDFIKSGRTSLRIVKEKNFRLKAEKWLALQRDEQIRLEKESLKIEEEFLGVKIKQVHGMFFPDIVQVTEYVNEYIMKIEAFIDNYFDLSSRLKMCVGLNLICISQSLKKPCRNCARMEIMQTL